MTALLVLLAWLAISAVVMLLWISYRRFVARHSLAEFDAAAAMARGTAGAGAPEPSPAAPRP